MIRVFSEMTRNNREMILMKKFICGPQAAVMALWMTGCNMGQSDTVTTAEGTNAENTAAQAGVTYTGTVTEVSAASITVETGTDGEVSIPLSDSTTFVHDEMGGPGENIQTPPDGVDQGTVYVQGSGYVTVTVESYSTNVDTSGAAAAGSWLDYAVEKA